MKLDIMSVKTYEKYIDIQKQIEEDESKSGDRIEIESLYFSNLAALKSAL